MFLKKNVQDFLPICVNDLFSILAKWTQNAKVVQKYVK